MGGPKFTGTRRGCLAVDFGTGSLRAALIDEHGMIRALKRKPVAYERSGLRLNFDAAVTFEDILDLLAAVVAEADRRLEIFGIAVTSQRNGNVFYDRTGRELGACPNIDKRVSLGALASMQALGPRIYAETGRWPCRFAPAMRLRWMKEAEPREYGKVYGVSMLNDWIAYRLSGNLHSEPTNAVESLLFSLAAADWSKSLKSHFDVPEIGTPVLIASGSQTGTLRRECAERIGLPASTGVYLAPADTQCAMIGAGVFECGEVGVINGSTTPVLMVTDSPRFDALYRTWTDPYVAGLYALESNCGESGNIYQKQVGDFNELMRKLGVPARWDDSALESALKGEDLRHSTLVFMGPGPCDFSKPAAVENLIRHDMKHENLFLNYFSACIENTAFAVAANISQLEEITGMTAGTLYLTGGGAESAYFRGIVHELRSGCGIVLPETTETTSLGAAVSAFAAYENAADLRLTARRMTRARSGEAFLPLESSGLKERYVRWLSLYKSLND